MQQYLEPSHKLPDEDSIRESLIKLVNNPDIQFILSSVHFTKKYKPSYWIQKENDRIIFAVKFKTKDAEISYVRLVKIERNDSAQTKIYTPFKELMRIVNSSGSYDFTYIYQDGSLIARVNPDGSKFYYHPDHLGSTSLITDQNGNIVEQTFYSPFGELLGGGSADVKLYTGQMKDSICQYYYGARYYNPCMSLWESPDKNVPKIFEPQSLNRFSYSLNNPYKFVDPTGRDAKLVIDDNHKEIAISTTIYIYGDAANADVAKQMEIAISSAWNGFTYQGGGTKYAVRVNVQVVAVSSKPSSIPMYSNAIEVTKTGVQSSSGKYHSVVDPWISNKGTWWGSNFDRVGNPASHEFGHLVGLSDRYDKTTGKPDLGWEKNKMAERDSTISKLNVEQRNINELIDPYFESKSSPINGFFTFLLNQPISSFLDSLSSGKSTFLIGSNTWLPRW